MGVDTNRKSPGYADGGPSQSRGDSPPMLHIDQSGYSGLLRNTDVTS